MDSYLDNFLSPRKVSLLLLSAFAATGIILGMIGIYGVVANSVVRRRREIAIRLAVGATSSSTMILIARPGLLAAFSGFLIGSIIVMSLTPRPGIIPVRRERSQPWSLFCECPRHTRINRGR